MHGFPLYWRSLVRDRIFMFLLIISLLSFLIALATRRAEYEQTMLPFELGLLFFAINLALSFLAARREPLLAYMFLTATILMNGTLYSYFRYLVTIQLG